MSKMLIHHATTPELWKAARVSGVYPGTAQDRADGFIHFSTAGQIVQSVERHLSGCGDLVLLSVDPSQLGPALVWEPSRNGCLFPHLYGALSVRLVVKAEALPQRASGTHTFPERIAKSG